MLFIVVLKLCELILANYDNKCPKFILNVFRKETYVFINLR